MQRAQVIDINKSLLPGDPNAFPTNLVSTDREDGEEQGLPIAPYEGYNILPTAMGYRSFFGVGSKIDVTALPSLCDEVLAFQTDQYENVLVALTADGIWTLRAGNLGWVQEVVMADDWGISGIYKQYTWCVIENDLYIYRAGNANVDVLNFDGTFTTLTPTFLNMAGQIGIFRANGRLAFWDSLNSIGWSDNIQLESFTPDLETMAGNTIFLGVQGNIVTVKSHGEGFVIYCTKSIVGVSYKEEGNSLWDPMVLTSAGGVIYPKAVTQGTNDKEHFAWTSMGIFSIGHFNALSRQYDFKPLVPELYDILKEDRNPVYLSCLAGRHLHIQLFSDKLLYGLVQWEDTNDPLYVNPGFSAAVVLAGGVTYDPPYEAQNIYYAGHADDSLVFTLHDGGSFGSAQFAELVAAFESSNYTVSAEIFLLSSQHSDGSEVVLDLQSMTLKSGVITGSLTSSFKLVYASGTNQFTISTESAGIEWDGNFYLMESPSGSSQVVAGDTSVTLTYSRIGNTQELRVNGTVINTRTDAGLATIANLESNVADMSYLALTWTVGSTGVEPTVFQSTGLTIESIGAANDYYDLGDVTTFQLREGAPAVGYNTIQGSWVYDLALKKWGKNGNPCQAIIALSPINQAQNHILTPTDFALDSGILSTDGFIKRFGVVVTDSLLKYGKIGFARLGFTTAFEIVLHFRNPATGTVILESSIDGKTVWQSATIEESFTDEVIHIMYVDTSARWFNIGITGTFDLTYLEFRGRISGRR